MKPSLARPLAGGFLAVLVACGGGGSSTPTAPATPVPTPTPVSYSGTYSGPMLFTSSAGTLNVIGTTTVTHSPNLVSLTNLVATTAGGSVTFPLGTAPLAGTFDGSLPYNSSGCGVITSRYHGYFGQSGTVMKMNLQVTLTPDRVTGSCGVNDIRGELTRN